MPLLGAGTLCRASVDGPTATTVEVFDAAQLVAHHGRAPGRHVEVLVLDHYLEVLKTKPGALPDSTALAHAKASGVFSTAHQRYWDAARRTRGDAAGTRALIEILLAHRTMPHSALLAAMDSAVDNGLLDPQVVLIEARRRTANQSQPEGAIPIGAWARYDRPAPTLGGYDALLTGSEG